MVYGAFSVLSIEVVTGIAWERTVEFGVLPWFDSVDLKSIWTYGFSGKSFNGVWRRRQLLFVSEEIPPFV